MRLEKSQGREISGRGCRTHETRQARPSDIFEELKFSTRVRKRAEMKGRIGGSPDYERFCKYLKEQ